MAARPSRRLRHLLATAALVAGAAACADEATAPPPAGSPSVLLVHIYYQTDEQLAELATELDLLEHADRQAGYVDALVDVATLDALRAEGLRVDVDLAQSAWFEPARARIAGFTCYRTVEETHADMAALVAAQPTLAALVDIGDSYDKVLAGGNPGYDLPVLVLTNQAIAGPKPRFFLMGAIHAREYATAEAALRFAESLVSGYGTDPDATWLLDRYELHVLPQANPDGRKIAETGVTQRKNNDRTLGTCADPATSTSQYGIDLNRNHTFKYGGAGTSTAPCNLTYRGPGAASAPEIQAVQSYVASIFADQRGPLDTDAAPATTTGLLISLHSYGPYVLYPWGWSATAAPNQAGLRTLGRKLGFHNGYPVCQSPSCLYAASGTTDDWSYGELGIASYTIEMGTTFFQSCSSFDGTVLPVNLAALRTAFKAARRPYQTPLGPDAVTVAVSASPVTAGTSVTLTATVTDTRYASNGWGTESTQNIAGARYAIDLPSWVAGASTTAMAASDGNFNTKTEGVTATVSTAGWSVGRHLIFVEGQDLAGNWGAPTAVFLDIQ